MYSVVEFHSDGCRLCHTRESMYIFPHVVEATPTKFHHKIILSTTIKSCHDYSHLSATTSIYSELHTATSSIHDLHLTSGQHQASMTALSSLIFILFSELGVTCRNISRVVSRLVVTDLNLFSSTRFWVVSRRLRN